MRAVIDEKLIVKKSLKDARDYLRQALNFATHACGHESVAAIEDAFASVENAQTTLDVELEGDGAEA